MRGAFILSKKNPTKQTHHEERDCKQDTASAGPPMGYGQKAQWCCAREGHRMWDWSHLRGNGKLYSGEALTDMNGGEQYGHSWCETWPHHIQEELLAWFGVFVGSCCIFLLVCFSVPSIAPIILNARNTCISGRMKPKILMHISQINTDLNGKSNGCLSAECQLWATECQDGIWVYPFRPPKQSCLATSPSLISRISSSTLFQIVFIELFQYIPDSVAVIHHIILTTYTPVLLGYIKIATNV